MNREDELQGITESLWKDNKELQTDLAEACGMLRNVLKEKMSLLEDVKQLQAKNEKLKNAIQYCKDFWGEYREEEGSLIHDCTEISCVICNIENILKG